MRILKNEAVNSRNKVTVEVKGISYYRLGGSNPQWKKTKSNHILNKEKSEAFEKEFSKFKINVSAVAVPSGSKGKTKASKELDKKVLELAYDKQLLQAVKLYKDATGLGLKESKDYVDALVLKNPPSVAETSKGAFKNNKELDKELIKHIESGALLAAVKTYKDATGMGLKESKDYVETLRLKIKK